MKEGLILVTNPEYDPVKCRKLADEGYHVQICTHPIEAEHALRTYFTKWIETPKIKCPKCDAVMGEGIDEFFCTARTLQYGKDFCNGRR